MGHVTGQTRHTPFSDESPTLSGGYMAVKESSRRCLEVKSHRREKSVTHVAVIRYPEFLSSCEGWVKLKGQQLVTGISHSGTGNGPRFARPTIPTTTTHLGSIFIPLPIRTVSFVHTCFAGAAAIGR